MFVQTILDTPGAVLLYIFFHIKCQCKILTMDLKSKSKTVSYIAGA